MLRARLANRPRPIRSAPDDPARDLRSDRAHTRAVVDAVPYILIGAFVVWAFVIGADLSAPTSRKAPAPCPTVSAAPAR